MRWRLPAIALAALVCVAPVAADPVLSIDSATWHGKTLTVRAHANALPRTDIEGLTAVLSVNGDTRTANVALSNETTTTTPVEQTVMLVFDASGSMAGARQAAAVKAAQQFLATVPDADPIGVVAFSANAHLLVQPTLDRTQVNAAITSIQPVGDTALFDAVKLSLDTAAPAAQCTVLVLSDGADTTSRTTKTQLITALQASSCKVNFVGFQASPQMLALMQQLATAGGGKSFATTDAAGIAKVFTRSLQTASADLTLTADFPAAASAKRRDVGVNLVTAAGTTLQQSTAVAAVPTAAPKAHSGGLGRDTYVLLFAFVFGLGLFILGLLYAADRIDRSRRHRAGKLVETYAMRRARQAEEVAKPTLVNQLETVVRPLLGRKGRADRWAMMLDGAALDQTPEQWLLIQMAIAVVLLLGFSAISGSPFSAALPALLLAWKGPGIYVRRRRAGRSKRFEAGLPDALMLMASSLRSGFALDQAIVAAAEQSDNEVATELKRAVQEIRIGSALEDALDRAATRIDSPDFHWVVTALRIQRRSGGNLAELLITVSKTVRQRADLAREVRALTAEGRLSSYVLMALPIGIFCFLLVTQPGYLTPMWSSTLGLIISAFGLVMLTVGWLLMKRLVRVDI